MLFFFQKKGEEISVERSKFFYKIFFEIFFKAWVSLIEKHHVDKKSKHLKKNYNFSNFLNFFDKFCDFFFQRIYN
jgi:hypothetical protein